MLFERKKGDPKNAGRMDFYPVAIVINNALLLFFVIDKIIATILLTKYISPSVFFACFFFFRICGKIVVESPWIPVMSLLHTKAFF